MDEHTVDLEPLVDKQAMAEMQAAKMDELTVDVQAMVDMQAMAEMQAWGYAMAGGASDFEYMAEEYFNDGEQPAKRVANDFEHMAEEYFNNDGEQPIAQLPDEYQGYDHHETKRGTTKKKSTNHKQRQRERRLQQAWKADKKHLERLDRRIAETAIKEFKTKNPHLAGKRQVTSNMYWLSDHFGTRGLKLRDALSSFSVPSASDPSSHKLLYIFKFDLPSLANHLCHELGIANRQIGRSQGVIKLDRLMDEWYQQQETGRDPTSLFAEVGAELACAWVICNHTADIPRLHAATEVDTKTEDHANLTDRLSLALQRLV